MPLGVAVGELLTSWQVGGARGGWKPFLHHISKSEPNPRRVIALKTPKKLPQVLSPDEAQSILDGCDRLRDRLLFAVLYDIGMRIGEALGLRHNDIAAAERQVAVRRRDNANGARAKSPTTRTIPVSGELIRCMPTTCMPSTATLTVTMCSSTCGQIRAGIR
jgi:integrase